MKSLTDEPHHLSILVVCRQKDNFHQGIIVLSKDFYRRNDQIDCDRYKRFSNFPTTLILPYITSICQRFESSISRNFFESVTGGLQRPKHFTGGLDGVEDIRLGVFRRNEKGFKLAAREIKSTIQHSPEEPGIPGGVAY